MGYSARKKGVKGGGRGGKVSNRCSISKVVAAAMVLVKIVETLLTTAMVASSTAVTVAAV